MSDEIINLLMKSIDEIKNSVQRVHERMDEMYRAGVVTRTECEKYRKDCPAAKRIPVGTTILIALVSSLITGILLAFVNSIMR